MEMSSLIGNLLEIKFSTAKCKQKKLDYLLAERERE